MTDNKIIVNVLALICLLFGCDGMKWINNSFMVLDEAIEIDGNLYYIMADVKSSKDHFYLLISKEIPIKEWRSSLKESESIGHPHSREFPKKTKKGSMQKSFNADYSIIKILNSAENGRIIKVIGDDETKILSILLMIVDHEVEPTLEMYKEILNQASSLKYDNR